MITTTIGPLAALSMGSSRFGPYSNVVVEHGNSGQSTISAYGDAHVVRLHTTNARLSQCTGLIANGKGACDFPGSGTLDVRPVSADSYEFRFSDPMKANIVEFIVDARGLERALQAMHSLE